MDVQEFIQIVKHERILRNRFFRTTKIQWNIYYMSPCTHTFTNINILWFSGWAYHSSGLSLDSSWRKFILDRMPLTEKGRRVQLLLGVRLKGESLFFLFEVTVADLGTVDANRDVSSGSWKGQSASVCWEDVLGEEALVRALCVLPYVNISTIKSQQK